MKPDAARWFRKCLLALAAVVLVATPVDEARADVVVVPVAGGYDIEISGQASAQELLEAIAVATGASIKGQPESATLAANHLRNISIERALRKFLPGAAFSVSYGENGTPSSIIFLSSDNPGATGTNVDNAGTPEIDDPSPPNSDSNDNGDTQPPDGVDSGDGSDQTTQ